MSFDFIIIGAGTAGCVLANRLSVDPAVRVLLIEAGPADKHELLHVPAGFNYAAFDPRFIWNYKTAPEPTLGGRQIGYMRGRALGGSSSINAMVHVRGQREDYDGWRQAGCPGWGWEDVLPYFIKSETHVASGNWHGREGPVRITRCQGHPATDAFIAAMREAGMPANDDFDGPSQEGAGYYHQAVFHGRRQSAARAYLHPIRHRKNLQIETGWQVDSIHFQEKRASHIRARDTRGVSRDFSASRQIILCGGTVGNVALLERSGIGQGRHLQQLGIPVLADRYAIGENVQDHFQAPVVVRVGSREATLNQWGRGWRLAAQILRYYLTRRGLLAFNAMQAGGFARTQAELSRPDVQIFFSPGALDPAVHPRRLHRQPGLTAIAYPVHPRSLGSIHLQANVPDSDMRIVGNYLADEHDQQTLLAGIRLLRRIFQQRAMQPYALQEISPGPLLTQGASDAELLAYCRQYGDSVHHPVGSCRMGNDEQAVVTPSLQVNGVDGLSIADASIMPRLPAANTNAATLMIAERAADLLPKRC